MTAVESRPAGSGLALRLRPDGWTEDLRLSGCTFAEALRFCATGVWQEQADGMWRRFLADPAIQELAGQTIDGLELTLYEDGSLRHVTFQGCPFELAVAFARFVVKFDVLASNPWLDPVE